jgi:Family of unknown function (DUF6069)
LLAGDRPGGLDAVDEAGQAAAAREHGVRQLVHVEAALGDGGQLEEDVVPGEYSEVLTMALDKPWKARLLAVVGAILVTGVLWVVADLILGIHLRAPASGGSPSWDIGPQVVAAATVAFSLVGWLVLALLERLSSRGHVVWLVIAVLALLASLSLPLSGTGVSGADRAILVLMHLAAGAVLIPSFYRTSPRRGA